MKPASHLDQLIGMLAEAAEIEHCLMCTYLYAAFSLKQGMDEDLLPHEWSAVKRWRAEIIAIATEEMLHLALVNNLLIAVGSPPHYRHFNSPASAGQFPADVAVALLPFDAATLDHFIYVERPSEAIEEDGATIDKPAYSLSHHSPAVACTSQERPAFTPHRNVARHPVMRAPVTADEHVQIVSEPALSLLDLGNSSYFLMLRLFVRMSDTANCVLPAPP